MVVSDSLGTLSSPEVGNEMWSRVARWQWTANEDLLFVDNGIYDENTHAHACKPSVAYSLYIFLAHGDSISLSISLCPPVTIILSHTLSPSVTMTLSLTHTLSPSFTMTLYLQWRIVGSRGPGARNSVGPSARAWPNVCQLECGGGSAGRCKGEAL